MCGATAEFGSRDMISFVNRDHIVIATVSETEILVRTTLGVEIRIPAPAATLARFADELANHVESNFVSICSAEVPVTRETVGAPR